MIAFHAEQRLENTQCRAALHDRLVEAVTACEHIPTDRKEQVLDRIEARYGEAVAFFEGIYDETVAFLTELKGSDSSPEEKKEALRQFFEGIKDRIKAWHEQHRPKGPKAD
jgi:hypothetical protein